MLNICERTWFRAWADYIYRALGCSAMIIIVFVVLDRVPFEWSFGYLYILSILIIATLISLADAISTLVVSAKGGWFLALVVGMATSMFVALAVGATLPK